MINDLPITIEEEKQMEAINNNIITGVSGKQYEPMDTSPPCGQSVHTPVVEPVTPVVEVTLGELFNTLKDTIERIGAKVTELESLCHQAKPTALTDFDKSIETVLENAEWLSDKLYNTIEINYDMETLVENAFRDLMQDYVRDEVETYMESFILTRRPRRCGCCCRDTVEEELESIVEDRLTDVVEEVLSDKITSATVKLEF
jgi:hypothetical protein